MLRVEERIKLEDSCSSLGEWEEKAMAPHSSTLAWKIPWTEEPCGLQSMGSQGVGHDWAIHFLSFYSYFWRGKWQPTLVFLPGESRGWRGLVGCSLWGCKASATTERLTHTESAISFLSTTLPFTGDQKKDMKTKSHPCLFSFLLNRVPCINGLVLAQGTKLLIKSSLNDKDTSEGNGAGCLQ